MPYASGRIYHDADSHVFEDPTFYKAFAEPAVRAKMPASCLVSVTDAQFEAAMTERAAAPVEVSESELMNRKLWRALGAFDGFDRSKALDLLGFSSQLVFDSFMRFHLREAEQGEDLDYLYGLARAHNRAMVDFCARDPRLLPVGYVPMADIDRANAMAVEAIAMGCAAVQGPADCPKHHSPSHLGFDRMWAALAEAGVPWILHLGAGRLPSDTFEVTGAEPERSFLGGDGKTNSFTFVATPNPVIETMTALIVDGVLHRHPELRIGLIEFGGTWVPGWMRFLDCAQEAFRRNEGRLKRLDLKLSEYVRRQVRCTVFPHEDAGWSIMQSAPEIFMFSSDYPHIEGGRNPIARFEASLDAAGVDADRRERFYRGNFEDFIGTRILSPLLAV